MTDTPQPTYTHPHDTRRRYLAGLGLLLGASALWSLSGALIKLSHQAGVDGVTIAFYRSFFASLVLAPLAWRRLHTLRRRTDRKPPRAILPQFRAAGFSPRGNAHPNVQNDAAAPHGTPATPGTRIGCAFQFIAGLRPAAKWCVVFFTLMTVTFAIATTKTEAANAIILQYTSTFWVFGLSPRVLGEKPKRGDVGLLALAMVGITIIFLGRAGTDLAGLVIALTSGLFYGLLTMMIRVMRDSDPAAVTLVNNVGSALLLFPVLLAFGRIVVPADAWVWLILMGVFQFGVPYYLYTLGLARMPAYQAALITLFEPVLVPVWAYLAVGERVPTTTFLGGSLILAALLLFIRAARRSQRAPRFAQRRAGN